MLKELIDSTVWDQISRKTAQVVVKKFADDTDSDSSDSDTDEFSLR